MQELLRKAEVPRHLQFRVADIIEEGKYRKPRTFPSRPYIIQAAVRTFMKAKGKTKEDAMLEVAELAHISFALVEKEMAEAKLPPSGDVMFRSENPLE